MAHYDATNAAVTQCLSFPYSTDRMGVFVVILGSIIDCANFHFGNIHGRRKEHVKKAYSPVIRREIATASICAANDAAGCGCISSFHTTVKKFQNKVIKF